HFVAWASSSPPKDAACTVLGLACTTASQCCSTNCVGGTCAPSPAACTANGAACGPGLPTCCSQGLNELCQGGICMPAITMFTASSCLGPGCAGIPVQIRYHQVGACNGYNPPTGPGHSAGPNQAYVFFAIESIDNSRGTTGFNFDPGRLFAEQGAAKSFLDSNLTVYADIFKTSAVVPTTVAAGATKSFGPNFGALIVATTAENGASEANVTHYPLLYDAQPSDPLVSTLNSNPAQ